MILSGTWGEEEEKKKSHRSAEQRGAREEGVPSRGRPGPATVTGEGRLSLGPRTRWPGVGGLLSYGVAEKKTPKNLGSPAVPRDENNERVG